ncbi:MAG TPA: glycerophosphodiester phosphodiesterase family protein [Pelagibacterium sp.]|uniref:glycerophosphodiester phosphodiesterase family protein n=1 Tax=Pelagibacterium sp. TaxID=1967288 RepID=UPI002BBCE2E3|nr:glycerophosphodiester phosphodiesterase family protein [Pelagibacterium sp.]HWJ88359.1 glycerophosphodiester phosphodiesterase family protein [Pelagibacterium sp.]
MKKVLLGALAFVILFVFGVWLANASWRAAAPTGEPVFVAHRGVHQIFDRDGIENDTCTAERIYPPRHALLENTIPSMQAAFAAGAQIVELDVHPTTDGQFAVFHDWTIDCRTAGTGETRSHTMAYLKTLDIGFGYTADGGETYPLRGTGTGAMPSLDDVLSAIPDGRFIVNFKSNDATEADRLASLVAANPQWRDALWGAYGGDAPTLRAAALLPGLTVWTRRGLVDCLGSYIGYGWTGIMPEACTNTAIMVPINIAPFLWGWPNLFIERFTNAGTTIILTGPFGAGDTGTAGIDDIETLAQVPAGFPGLIWTNVIEQIGPKARND